MCHHAVMQPLDNACVCMIDCGQYVNIFPSSTLRTVHGVNYFNILGSLWKRTRKPNFTVL